MVRDEVGRLRRLVVLGSIVLLTAGGCAGTAKKDADADLALRRAQSHFNIAVDHQKNGRIELALRELLTAQRLDPSNPRIEHALAIGYLQKGRDDLAEQHFDRALVLAPSYQEARYNLSTLYLNRGQYRECIVESKRLHDDPTFSQPWRALTNWGFAAYKLGRTDEARQHFRYALEYNADYWPTQLNLGILEAEQGNKVEAMRYFERVMALQAGPSAEAEASYRMAEIYVSMGKRREAVDSLRTAVVKAPSDPWGKKSEEYLKALR